MFDKKHQKFIVESDLKTQYYIGDVTKLKRVVMNLLNNASKYTQENGTIKLILKEENHYNPQYSNLIISVEDNGIGIPEDKFDLIFMPFEQLDTKVRSEGTGLGLPIVRSIVESQGGTITVKSKVGKGSTFTVKIPMRFGNSTKTVKNDSCTNISLENIDLSNLRVLLVEDHPINILVAKRLLEKCNAKVEIAENGLIGYDKLVNSTLGTYNIIFMDIQMPVMNGYEATKAIRESNHPQAKTIPIIAMTANAFTEDIQKSLNSGMNGHIAKPISIDSIVKAIHAYFKEFS